MDWPKKLTVQQWERIRDGCGWDAAKCTDPDILNGATIYPEWVRLLGDFSLALQVLFFWTVPIEEGDSEEIVKAKSKEFKSKLDAGNVSEGLTALEDAVADFSKALSQSDLFGATMKKLRATVQVQSRKMIEAVESINPESPLATTDEKSTDSPAKPESTHGRSPTGS